MRIVALAALAVIAGCRSQAATGGPATATIFVSADMRGYLEPCGCSENMRGGIDRMAYQVLEARKSGVPVLYADSGDSLFPKVDLPPEAVPQENAKAQAIRSAFHAMGIVHRTLGELDGKPTAPGAPAWVESVAGHRIALVSAQSATELEDRASATHAEFVLGLVHDSFEHGLNYPQMPVDLLVTSHAPTSLAGEESRLTRAALPVAQLQSKGRALLRLDLTFGGGGRFELLKGKEDLSAIDERIALLEKQIDAPSLRADTKALYQSKLAELVQRREALASTPLTTPPGKNVFTARFIPLEATLPRSPEATTIVDTYDRAVAALNLAWAKSHGKDCPAPAKGEAGYVGNEACRDCHADAFPVWDASKHARAYEDLARVGKNYRVDCVGCHVVGYQAAGGVCRVDKVDGRRGVGCEDCHGPGSIHSDDPTKDNVVRRPGKELCVKCHDPENSPHFDWALYLPEIVGPGHGKPVADGGHLPRKR